METISISLVFMAPFAVGFLTVTLSGLKRIQSGWSAFFRPWLTSLVLLVITIILSLEGAICWIMIFPVFATAAGVGGLMAYHMMRSREKRQKGMMNDDILDDFDRKDSLKVSLLLMLPLLFGMVEQDRLLSAADYTVVCSVDIPAPAERVWASLTSLPDIKQEEHHSFFTDFFGLPRQLRTDMDSLAIGGKRTAIYERGVYFEETITGFQPQEWLKVAIKADPGNIPPTVLDEHIVIGGKHFKALEDTYRLSTLPNGNCRLELSGRIEINTPFNWYSGLWARWLLADTFDNLLGIIKTRATAGPQ
jgi:hypothetical protein